MKSLLLIVCMSWSLGTFCQNPEPQQKVATPEEMISSALKFGAIEGGLNKQVSRMGDAAAVSLTRALAERSPSQSDIEVALAILRSSFADPSQIQFMPDREPRTAMFVMQAFERYATDPRTKQDIAETKAYVEQQFARYKQQLKP